jgi:hypothetical protein
MRPDIEEIYTGDFDKAGAGIGCPCGAFIYSNEQLQVISQMPHPLSVSTSATA